MLMRKKTSMHALLSLPFSNRRAAWHILLSTARSNLPP